MTITYRTSGPWGVGFGADLSAVQIDNNFWDLSGRVTILEAWPTPAEIDEFVIDPVTGQMTVIMDDYTTRGPYQIPVYRPTAFDWAADLYVIPGMMFAVNATIYTVVFPHITVAPFDPNENDGLGHDYYQEFITVDGVLPVGGAAGMALVKLSGTDYDVTWTFAVLPTGGTAGQVLGKLSSTDYDADWVDNLFEDLADVGIVAPLSRDVLRYDASDAMWKNEALELTTTELRNSTVTSFTGSGAVEIDPTLGDVFYTTMTGDISIDFTSVAVPGALITLCFFADAGGVTRTITFPQTTTSVFLGQATLVVSNYIDVSITFRCDQFEWIEVARTQDAQLHHLSRQNSRSTNYTVAWTDIGGHILHPSSDASARNWTINSNASLPLPIGSEIEFVNQNGAGVISILITTDTMRLSPGGTTGTRTLAANGWAKAKKITATEWIIQGTGLT